MTSIPANETIPNAMPGRPPEEPGFVVKYGRAILLVAVVLCLAGVYAAYHMPASVFPQTDFPRVVVLVDNGAMPADEMMATITRPIEEAMKDIPGVANIRSATGRGAAEVNVFFDWRTDMVEAELFVLNRISQVKSVLPATAETDVQRLTFSSFPIVGISLTSATRPLTELWETAEYEVKPRLLRVDGVARVKLVGGDVPEYHVLVDPHRLEAHNLALPQVVEALASTNLFTPAGMHEEDRQLYLTVIDGRVRTPEEIGDIPVAWRESTPVLVSDVASVVQGAAPRFNIVSADGNDAVLLNIYSQPDGNTVAIARDLNEELARLGEELPPDVRLAFFYDQSQFVLEGVSSVWSSIIIGLLLSTLVLFMFLGRLSATFVAAVGIPATILMTLVGMYALNMSFNLMTLGGIAAAIGLIIDDAIVVVEASYAKICAGHAPHRAAGLVLREVGMPLVGSTLTPVAVFIPLAYLDGVPGVFFRALALTMVCSLLISLLLAVTLTPTLGAYLLRARRGKPVDELDQGGPILRRLIGVYEGAVRQALRYPVAVLAATGLVFCATIALYLHLDADFLPEQDEGAFVLDYFTRPGTSLKETDRSLRKVEKILQATPEVESYSRRTGARLALAIAEPNTGDFLVKLKQDRTRGTTEVIDDLRQRITDAEPALNTEFPGVLADLIGDLTWSPDPIEIKIFSTDTGELKTLAAQTAEAIEAIPGVVDVNDGLVVAGPSLTFRVRTAEAARVGLTPAYVGSVLQTALLGQVASHVLEGDRVVDIRVMVKPENTTDQASISTLPMHAPEGAKAVVGEVTQVEREPGLLEMHREDQRQLVAVSARLSGMDLRTGINLIRDKLVRTLTVPPGASIEYGGLYEQQQRSFRSLALVLGAAILLVFMVLVVEFHTITHALAIIAGAVLGLFGVVAALWVTGMSINIVSYLGAIIGVGIVAKNGILMLDFVNHLRARGLTLREALVQSGRRRLRPVLMTSLTTFLGLLPLAYGVGAGADMLRPLAIGVIGAMCVSLALSLVATPVFYLVLETAFGRHGETERRIGSSQK
jgi:CzcA family heavy metal efflux pump